MPGPFLSNTGYVGFAKQTASGSYVTPSRYMFVDSFDVNPETEILIPDPEIGPERDIFDGVRVGQAHWTGSLAFKVRPEAVGLLIFGAMGAVTSSGIAGQSPAVGHLFTPQNQLVPLSFEHRVGYTGNLMDVFGLQDAKVNVLRFECAAGELVQGTAEIVGIEERSGKTNQTPTFETAPIFSFVDGIVNLEGSPLKVRSCSFELNNNLKTDDFRIGQRLLETLLEGRRELSASLETVPTDASLFKKTYYGASGSTQISNTADVYTGSLFLRFECPTIITGAASQKYSLDITVTKAAFRTAPIPISGDDMVIQTLDLLPLKVTGSNVCTMVLRNGVSSY